MDVCREKLINPDKLYSVTAYAKKMGLTKGRISQKVKEGELKIVQYRGGYLIYEP